MPPACWQPSVALSSAAEASVTHIRRAKLFVFLCEWRHELFDAAVQEELAAYYQDSTLGQPPIPPAQLALATLLQAYTGVSDDERIEATVIDRRWPVVLDCLDCTEPPFSKGTLVAFRQRLIDHTGDRGVGAPHGGGRSAAVARGAGQQPAAQRVPGRGAGRGHVQPVGLRLAQGAGRARPPAGAGADVVAGTSLKAALDLDWDDPTARALHIVLAALVAAEGWVGTQPDALGDPAVQAGLGVAHEVRAQAVVQDAGGAPLPRQGVAAECRISAEDAEMRHGRKSRSRLLDGYKRHVPCDVETTLVHAVGVTPANAPEASVTDSLSTDLAHQDVVRRELHCPSHLAHRPPPGVYADGWSGYRAAC